MDETTQARSKSVQLMPARCAAMPVARPHGPAPTTARSSTRSSVRVSRRGWRAQRCVLFRRERLVEICNQVGGVLDAECEANEAITDADIGEIGRAHV